MGVGVLLADQISKTVALALDAGSSARSGDGWFSVRQVRNTGASFGIGAGHPLVITVLAMTATAAVAMAVFRTRNTPTALAWAVVLGGAGGNLADRLFRAPGLGHGPIIDWIHVAGYPATFNLADLAIRAGALAVVITIVLSDRSRTERRMRGTGPVANTNRR
jgi:signal peptidase II